MTSLVVLSALGMSLGVLGLVTSMRRRVPSLHSALSGLVVPDHTVPGPRVASHPDAWRLDRRVGGRVAREVWRRELLSVGSRQRMAIADIPLEELLSQCVLSATVGTVLPTAAWGLMMSGGVRVPFLVPVWVGVLFGVCGGFVPIMILNAEASRRRLEARAVICSFLDLVVLSLAGGMGIESALLAAANVGQSDISRRMWKALSSSRDTGEAPWEALGRLGQALGLDELSELAAAAALAGTEGARVRSTLAARAATIRRHQLAEAEADANAVTERLFLPGTFLLVGFLIFIGYPAFTRIASGF